MGVDARDRRIVWIAAGALAVMVGLALLFPPPNQPAEPFASSYSAAAGGAKAAFDWLAESGYPVARWLQPAAALPRQPRGVVLVLVDPVMAGSATAADRTGLERFLDHGGRVVTTNAYAQSLFPSIPLPVRFTLNHAWRDYPAIEAGTLTRNAPTIRLAPQWLWPIHAARGPAASPYLPVYGDLGGEDTAPSGPAAIAGDPRPWDRTGGAAIILIPRGQGQIVWWSSATPLTNAGIGQAGNAQLLLNSIGAGGARAILWDEYYHGERSGLGREAAVAWHGAALPLAVLAFALLWSFARRSGPMQAVTANAPRESPLEFATHLGGMYERAHAADLALGVLTQAASHQCGGGAVPEAVAHLLRQSGDACSDPALPEKTALRLARQLQQLVWRQLEIMPTHPDTALAPAPRVAAVAEALDHLHREAAKAVVGQRELLDLCLLTVLCRGHALIEGVPGLAKTLAVKVFARLLELTSQRVQATPDLLPGDILGGNVLLPTEGRFRFRPGPIFTDLLLVDEINRMPPRTQAALLEAMEERQVTLEGVQHPLPSAFTVFATQNPIEFEGTYPLPEAQLDRFLIKIVVPYPSLEDELAIVGRERLGTSAASLDALGLIPFPPNLLAEAQAAIHALAAAPPVVAYVAAIARRSREWPALHLGASPRAGVALLGLARAMAACEGRDFVLPDDVKAAALPVLRHRILLRPEADLEGLTPDRALRELLAAIEVPILTTPELQP